MKTIKYIIAILLVECFCFLSINAQSNPSGKRQQKIKIVDDLSVLVINKIVGPDTLRKLDLFITPDNLIFTDSISIENISAPKVSIFNIGGNFNMRSAKGSFSLHENNISFMNFSDGKGNNISIGLGYEFYVCSFLSIESNIYYDKHYIKSTTDYFLPIIDDKFAKTEHTAELNLENLSAELLLKYEIFDNMQIYSGMNYNILLSSTYNHIVKLQSDEIIYSDGSTEKHFNENKLDNTNNRYSACFGISYRVPFITDNYGASIGCGYNLGLNKLFSNSDLKSSSIHFGIKLLYLF